MAQGGSPNSDFDRLVANLGSSWKPKTLKSTLENNAFVALISEGFGCRLRGVFDRFFEHLFIALRPYTRTLPMCS